jgi:hypothetical protein
MLAYIYDGILRFSVAAGARNQDENFHPREGAGGGYSRYRGGQEKTHHCMQ